MRNALALTILPLLAVACTSYPAADSAKENGRISVSTSALSLPNIGEACYDLHVSSSVGELLWTQHVCASDGKGAVSYVGSCDVVNNPNVVSLSLASLSDTSGSPMDFTNPCPVDAPCTQTVECHENRTTPVSFDLTTMRHSGQGFFDVDVSIQDIACSASLDCLDGTNARPPMVMLTWGCLKSPNAQAMRMSDVTLDCDSPNGPVSFTIDPSSHGQTSSSESSFTWTVDASPPDVSALDAMGVTSCTVHASGTATKETDLVWSPRSNVYPFIDWNVPVVTRDASGALSMACGSHALDAPNSGVSMSTVDNGKHTKTGHVTLMK